MDFVIVGDVYWKKSHTFAACRAVALANGILNYRRKNGIRDKEEVVDITGLWS
jgi:hypothetical protein